MNSNATITELQRLAESITKQDIAMMISHGGAANVYHYQQLRVAGLIDNIRCYI